MQTFVINLNKFNSNYIYQKPFLENIGLKVNRFSAIDATNNDHLNYKHLIPDLILNFIPKSIIGCSLSHILLANQIFKSGKPISLIMEDDAFPLFNKKQFQIHLNQIINEINILDKNWDIIQLHSDAPFPTPETYSNHIFSGSTAAYLISHKGAQKLAKEKVYWHADIHTSINSNFRKYRAKNNLFWTKENESLNRKNDNSFLTNIKSSILSQLIPLRGEKTWNDFFNFKMIKILDKDITANHLTNLLIILFIINTIKNIKN